MQDMDSSFKEILYTEENENAVIKEASSNNDEHDDYIQELCEDALNVLFNPMLLLA